MSDESTPRVMSKGGPLVDHPGWWMVEVWKEDNLGDTRSFVRREDGTYWDIAVRDLFPRSGGTLKITLGEEIKDEKRLSICRDFYTQLKKKMDEGGAMTRDTLERLKKMSADEKQVRFEELNAVIGAPQSVSGGVQPKEHSQQEMEEWAWLKEQLAM